IQRDCVQVLQAVYNGLGAPGKATVRIQVVQRLDCRHVWQRIAQQDRDAGAQGAGVDLQLVPQIIEHKVGVELGGEQRQGGGDDQAGGGVVARQPERPHLFVGAP